MRVLHLKHTEEGFKLDELRGLPVIETESVREPTKTVWSEVVFDKFPVGVLCGYTTELEDNSLIDIAEMAFWKPNISLRLITVMWECIFCKKDMENKNRVAIDPAGSNIYDFKLKND